LASGSYRLGAIVEAPNSVLGAAGNGGASMNYAYDTAHDRLIVPGLPVSLFHSGSRGSPVASSLRGRSE
jgi:hypothetical protein